MVDVRYAALAVGLAAVLFRTAPSMAQNGDAQRGAALAESWCVECHIIDRQGTGTARDAAPTFPDIANARAANLDFLRGWLQGAQTHVQMPDFNVGRRDTEDLIAYFRKLVSE